MAWVDAGNFSAVGIPSADVRNQGMVDGLNSIGYHAVMLGERELADGFNSFEALRKRATFPFVSANIVFEDDMTPLVKPYVIHPFSRGGRTIRVAFLGLNRYNTAFLKSTDEGRNIIVTSPFEAARKLIPEIREKSDVLVLLTALSISQSRQLAREVEGIDLIIGANGGVLSRENDQSSGTPIIYTGNQGKHLSEIRLSLGDAGPATRVRHHYLNRTYPSNTPLQQLVQAVLVKENDINRELASAHIERPRPVPGVPGYVGSGTCAECHEGQNEAWLLSSHSHAFKTLVDHDQDFNNECVSCHVVGFGRRGGFVNAKATPELADVQCEACHGPGSVHVDEPKPGYGAAGARSCLRCHDPENSPEFDFYKFWPKIQH